MAGKKKVKDGPSLEDIKRRAKRRAERPKIRKAAQKRLHDALKAFDEAKVELEAAKEAVGL